MTRVKTASLIGGISAIIALLLAFGLEQNWIGVGTVVCLMLIVWLADRFNWSWRNNLMFLGISGLVIFGVFVKLSSYLLLVAMLGIIANWDLSRFEARCNPIQRDENILEMEKRHIRLLGSTLLGGGILSIASLSLQFKFDFGVLLFLGMMLIVGIGQILRLLRN